MSSFPFAAKSGQYRATGASRSSSPRSASTRPQARSPSWSSTDVDDCVSFPRRRRRRRAPSAPEVDHQLTVDGDGDRRPPPRWCQIPAGEDWPPKASRDGTRSRVVEERAVDLHKSGRSGLPATETDPSWHGSAPPSRYFEHPVNTPRWSSRQEPHRAQGRAALVVNVASKCGLTPQYTGLEKLQEELGDEGSPCSGFPATSSAARSRVAPRRSRRSVRPPTASPSRSSRVDVNGAGRHPLYER